MPSSYPLESLLRGFFPGFLVRCRTRIQRGERATLRLEPLGDWRGFRMWARVEEQGPYREMLEEEVPALAMDWEARDIHHLQVVAFSAWCGEYRKVTVPIYGNLQRAQVELKTGDHGVIYAPEWVVGAVEGDPWDEPIEIAEPEWRQPVESAPYSWDLSRASHKLFVFEDDSSRRHLAVRWGQELTVGRLHAGTDRELNQSGTGVGAHWHLGWQRFHFDPVLRNSDLPVPEEIRRKSRHWMSRRMATLRARLGETPGVDLVDRRPSEVELRPRGPRRWRLDLAQEPYRDSLQIDLGESEVVSDRRATSIVPWLWACRENIEKGRADRYFLWLPWSEEMLRGLRGAHGDLAGQFRFWLGDGVVRLYDESWLHRLGS